MASLRGFSRVTPTATQRALWYSTAQQVPEPPPTRWLADVKARIGKCITFGCSPAQVQRAADVLEVVATDWRALTAGSDGFLTGSRRGLEGHVVAWGEMDSFRHVNNANYLRWAETSRVRWITHFAGVDTAHATEWQNMMSPWAVGLIMKSIRADYKFPIVFPDRVSVYHRLRNPPLATDSSLILDCIILSYKHQRIAARTEEDIVMYDYANARKTTIPPFALKILQDTFLQQQEMLAKARSTIWGLLREVEALEKETWDRDDAVEDLGAASTST